MTGTISIGGLSKATGVNIETIRYYERIGIIPAPPRTEAGHRIYDAHHTGRLNFVRRGRQLGFTLDQVRTLLNLADGGGDTWNKRSVICRAWLRFYPPTPPNATAI